ncbi:dihydrofolate reductase family protein [Streptomyces bobili]|uniref:dihydrofolate reductase family protein n=1 Tax=Streptomyces bobili TaxID=67280 RepID=UPI0036FF56E1
MSLDGFIAGPNSRPDNPLGDGGMRIHEWVFGVESWRARQNIDGGQTNQDDDIVQENFSRAGACVMGRKMFAEGEVGWPDPPPFRAPVFVLTHTPREPWVRKGGTTFTFVTEGIDSALAHARKAAGDKDVQISGGADAVRQFIDAGLLDELQIHLAAPRTRLGRPALRRRLARSRTRAHTGGRLRPGHSPHVPDHIVLDCPRSHDGATSGSRVLAQLLPVVAVHSASVSSSSRPPVAGRAAGVGCHRLGWRRGSCNGRAR